MNEASSSTHDKGSKPQPRTLEELMAAPTVDTPDTLLSEAGQMKRRLGELMFLPLPELLERPS